MASTVSPKQVPSTAKSEKESFWTGGRITITLIAVGLVGWWAISRWTAPRVPNIANPPSVTTKKPPTSNASAPAIVPLPAELRDATVQTIDGGSLKLSDFSDKVLVVNIWATWCGPCRMEMPDLVKLNREYKARGVVVLGLTRPDDRGNSLQRVQDYVREQNVDYTIIWDDGSLGDALVQAVQGRPVIPQSFVISRDGRIVKHFSGFNAYQTPQIMRQVVEDALSGKT